MIGQILNGRYEILERVGGGGMAVVLKARDRFLGRTVAIKVLRDQFAGDGEFLRRFRREAQAVASLSHPNIVPLFDFGQDEGTHYLVMEYVEGETLQEKVARDAPLAQRSAVDIAVQILDGLEHAHQKQVIHRDIKPHNIMITPRGRVKVADFGVAQAAHGSTLVHTGDIVGSAHYFSPEQARGGPVDYRSDLYSLGVVLFEMLTGRLPFEGDNPVSVALKHVQEEAPCIRSIKEDLSPTLEAIVLRAMAKDPARRYQSAAEFRTELEAWRQGEASQDVPARTVDSGSGADSSRTIVIQDELWERAFGDGEERPRSRRRWGRVLAWLITILILVGVAGYGFYTFMRWFQVPPVEVPSVEGLSIDAAQIKLDDRGLGLRVDARVPSRELLPNYIIKQDPAAGEQVKRGRIIGVTLSQGPELVEVPNVEGKNRFEAETLLQAGDFVIRITFEFDEATGKDDVIQQNPRPGTRAEEGSTVFLEVSLGPPPPPFSMPNLVGSTRDDALRALKNAGLEKRVERQEKSGFPEGIVAGQDPLPGVLVRIGEKVELVISSGCAATIQRVITIEGFEPVRITASLFDRLGRRDVYDQTHLPGQQAVIDICWDQSPLRLLIYADGDLIDQEVLP